MLIIIIIIIIIMVIYLNFDGELAEGCYGVRRLVDLAEHLLSLFEQRMGI